MRHSLKRLGWIERPRFRLGQLTEAMRLERKAALLASMIHPKDAPVLAARALEDEIRTSSEIEWAPMDAWKLRLAIAGEMSGQSTKGAGREERAVQSALLMMWAEGLSHGLLCGCHSLLGTFGEDCWGRYRDHPESVYDGDGKAVYEAPEAPEALSFMDLFVKWWNSERKRMPAPIGAALGHLYFELIHPFHDGNGRIGRMLIGKAWEGGGRCLPFSISAIIARDRNAYYGALEKAALAENLHGWISWMLEVQNAALEDALCRAVRMRGIRRWLDRTDFRPESSDLEIIHEMGLAKRRRWTQFEATRLMPDGEIAARSWERLCRAGVIRDGWLELQALTAQG